MNREPKNWEIGLTNMILGAVLIAAIVFACLVPYWMVSSLDTQLKECQEDLASSQAQLDSICGGGETCQSADQMQSQSWEK